jgi:glycosyltransferase involved in cell wall biosynthesis
LGEAGRLFPKNDFHACRDILAELLENPEERIRLGQLAQQRAHDHYSWDAVLAQYEALFCSEFVRSSLLSDRGSLG